MQFELCQSTLYDAAGRQPIRPAGSILPRQEILLSLGMLLAKRVEALGEAGREETLIFGQVVRHVWASSFSFGSQK